MKIELGSKFPEPDLVRVEIPIAEEVKEEVKSDT